MISRRSFLTTATLAALRLRSLSQAIPPPPDAFGLQLYTIRKDIQSDTPGVLAAVRKIGYRSVETFDGQYVRPAKDLKQMIDDAGLSLPSAHFGYGDFGSRFDYAAQLGVKYMVVGAPPFNKATTADAFKGFAAQYNKWGEQAAKQQMEFGFHNHNVEFRDFGGVTGLDILMRETDLKLVKWQMDCYWVVQAGQDPLVMMQRFRQRLQTLHFKDRLPGFPVSTTPGPAAQHFTEVGAGTIPYKKIWDLAKSIGITYFFVEQDQTTIPPLESVKISFDNLKRMVG